MENNSFLDKVAIGLLNEFPESLSDVTVVLPNKRARLFLFQALQRHSGKTLFAPNVISIEDFIQDIAGIRSVDNIELLFEFYDVYINATTDVPEQNFETFANWAKTLIQDFNEIDRYLLPPFKVLAYLKDIEDIKHWSLDPNVQTDLIRKHLQFWELLPTYYTNFYAHLLAKNIGYQGLIYREAVRNIEFYSATVQNKRFVFAGFNALNAAEELIIQHFITAGNASVYWDIDKIFLNDSYHDAGLFIRRFKQNWHTYKQSDFNWVDDSFAGVKNLHIIGTPKMIGQAKIVGKTIEKIVSSNHSSLDKVAIVLAEESLLIPLLYALPSQAGALNITMGYSAKNNPAQTLIAALFKMHTGAIARDSVRYVFYFKDILDILAHPLVEPYANAADLVWTIKLQNYTFLSRGKLYELHPASNGFFDDLFAKWNDGALPVLKNISEILLTIKLKLSANEQQERITKTFVFAIYKVINKLQNYYTRYGQTDDLKTLYALYKQVVDLAEVSFEGEPLEGLQIMGVLESRVLDFDTVIITSVNEGKFPAGKSSNSFIPYDVKREFGLPTYKEKDAIYTYHFYHLLQRAKNVYLLYNTESEGLDAGEKSRFITQLLVEKQPNHHITESIYSAEFPDSPSTLAVIYKSDTVITRLADIAKSGFSPTALTSYIRNPIDFYYKKVLRIRDAEEVEENIALNTLGTIIHEALRSLLEPFINKILTEADIAECRRKVNDEVYSQFREIYKQGEINSGRNLLAFEVAKRNVVNFLRMESQSLQNGEVVRILALESKFDIVIDHADLPFPVKIGGTVDRIEERDGIIRIIDYKTGRVEPRDLTLKCWDNLTDEMKNDKIIQILSYAMMIRPMYADKEIQAGIISFKNIKCGFMPFEYIEDKIRKSTIDDHILEAYRSELIILLNRIFDRNEPFTEKIV